MVITVFEIVIITSALCGLFMVFGGLLLLYKGIITLTALPSATALDIQWKKKLRVTTQVPGIALFLLGLSFIVTALFFVKPQSVKPLELKGNISNVSEMLNIRLGASWHLPQIKHGEIRERIYPDINYLKLEISAPGYKEYVRKVDKNHSMIDLGEIVMERITEPIPVNQDNIVPLEFEVSDIVAENQTINSAQHIKYGDYGTTR